MQQPLHSLKVVQGGVNYIPTALLGTALASLWASARAGQLSNPSAGALPKSLLPFASWVLLFRGSPLVEREAKMLWGMDRCHIYPSVSYTGIQRKQPMESSEMPAYTRLLFQCLTDR